MRWVDASAFKPLRKIRFEHPKLFVGEELGDLSEQVAPVGVSRIDDRTVEVRELLFLVRVVQTRAGYVNDETSFRFVSGRDNVSGSGIER